MHPIWFHTCEQRWDHCSLAWRLVSNHFSAGCHCTCSRWRGQVARCGKGMKLKRFSTACCIWRWFQWCLYNRVAQPPVSTCFRKLLMNINPFPSFLAELWPMGCNYILLLNSMKTPTDILVYSIQDNLHIKQTSSMTMPFRRSFRSFEKGYLPRNGKLQRRLRKNPTVESGMGKNGQQEEWIVPAVVWCVLQK